jgi:transposase
LPIFDTSFLFFSMADYQTGKILQVTRGRSSESIKKALEKWPYEAPKLVITDLAPAFQNTISEVWTRTKMAADHLGRIYDLLDGEII